MTGNIDAQRVDATSATCATVAAVVRHTGRESACDCGRIYTPRWSDADDAPPVAPLTAARAAWPGVLRDLSLARLYARQEAARVPGGPADASGLLGRLQGRAGGATRDASGSQVATMWGLLTRGGSERARAGFVAALVRHCEETTRPDTDAVDWDHARRCAERLRRLCARGGARRPARPLRHPTRGAGDPRGGVAVSAPPSTLRRVVACPLCSLAGDR